MAMKARYTVISGEVIFEKRGANHRTYVPDANGNSVALVDDGGTVTDTFTYWPYGEVKSRTGTTPTPFQFGGVLGYYKDTGDRYYVRTRHYNPGSVIWTSVDRYWPREQPYQYARENPATFNDPMGTRVNNSPGGCYSRCWRTYKGYGFSDANACYRCKEKCGSKVDCVTTFTRYPLELGLGDFAQFRGLQISGCAVCVTALGLQDLDRKYAPLGYQDKLYHCIASCLAKIKCPICPDELGTLHEVYDQFFGGVYDRTDIPPTDDGVRCSKDYSPKFFSTSALNLVCVGPTAEDHCVKCCRNMGWR
jgi:RHS repeat-associated protein